MGRLSGEVVAMVAMLAMLWGNNCMTVKGADDVSEKCNMEFRNLQYCLGYTAGVEEAPSVKCCKSVSETWKNDAVCLCYLLLTDAVLNGFNTPEATGMEKLIALPTICKVPDVNISECQGLLELPAASPESAILNGSSGLFYGYLGGLASSRARVAPARVLGSSSLSRSLPERLRSALTLCVLYPLRKSCRSICRGANSSIINTCMLTGFTRNECQNYRDQMYEFVEDKCGSTHENTTDEESSSFRMGPNYSNPSIVAAAVSAIFWSFFS